MKNICIFAVPARKYKHQQSPLHDIKKSDYNAAEEGYHILFIREGQKA